MSSFTGYLQSLTPSQRDVFLEKTMILVDQPIEHKVNIGYLTFVEEDTPIVNYSQFYSLLPPDLKSSSFHHFPDPSILCNGDKVIFGVGGTGGLRGLGSHYVLWMKQGMIQHDQAFISAFEKRLATTMYPPGSSISTDRDGGGVGLGQGPIVGPAHQGQPPRRAFRLQDYPLTTKQWYALAEYLNDEEWYESWPHSYYAISDCESLANDLMGGDHYGDLYQLILSTHLVRKDGKDVHPFPRLVSREEFLSFQKSEREDVYLFIHPDEMGYFLPSSLSTVPSPHYLSLTHTFLLPDNSEKEKMSVIIDPLLTHSLSYYGKKIQTERKGEIRDVLGYCDYLEDEMVDDEYSEDDDDRDHDSDIREWIPIEGGSYLMNAMSLSKDRNYFEEVRTLFIEHFQYLQSIETLTNA